MQPSSAARSSAAINCSSERGYAEVVHPGAGCGGDSKASCNGEEGGGGEGDSILRRFLRAVLPPPPPQRLPPRGSSTELLSSFVLTEVPFLPSCSLDETVP